MLKAEYIITEMQDSGIINTPSVVSKPKMFPRTVSFLQFTHIAVAETQSVAYVNFSISIK